MTSLYLASGSPRRQELLTQLGVSFERIVTGIEEKRAEGESAQQYVSRLAREKAQAGVAQTPRDLPVLGADTIVIFNGEVLEKPRDAEHAAHMLRKLSGQTQPLRWQTAKTCSIVWWLRTSHSECLPMRKSPVISPAVNLWIKQVHTVFKGWVAVLSGRSMAAITP